MRTTLLVAVLVLGGCGTPVGEPEDAPDRGETYGPPPRSSATTGFRIRVDSVPTGARIRVGDRDVGEAPVDLVIRDEGSATWPRRTVLVARYKDGSEARREFEAGSPLPQSVLFDHRETAPTGARFVPAPLAESEAEYESTEELEQGRTGGTKEQADAERPAGSDDSPASPSGDQNR